MKILFFLLAPNPFPEAAWTRIGFFAEHFQKKGNDVAIIGVFSLKTLKKAGFTRWNGISISNIIPMVLMQNVFSLIFNLLTAVCTSFVLFPLLRPTIVVISVPPGEAALGPYIIAKLFRIKKIVFDYRDEWEDFAINTSKSKVYRKSSEFFKSLMAKCYLNSDLVITVTRALMDSLALREVRNVRVLTNGADSDVFKPYDKKTSRSKMRLGAEDFVIVYNGIIGSYYRLDIVVSGVKRLASRIPNIKLIIVGYGPALKEIINMSKELGIQNNIQYYGATTDLIRLAEMLSAADLGILPYDSDPKWVNLRGALPVKVFEYLACGLPVIATAYNDSLLAKLISDNNLGLISDPGNVDALVENIQKMYHDDLFLRDVSKRAVILVKERYNRNSIAEEFLNIIEC